PISRPAARSGPPESRPPRKGSPLRSRRLSRTSVPNCRGICDAGRNLSPSSPASPESRMPRVLLPVLLFLTPALVPAAPTQPAEPQPDLKSLKRDGAGYRYTQAGWVVLHVEGEPYERGYQHGRLMAAEIAEEVKALAAQYGHKAPDEAWAHARPLANALFPRKLAPRGPEGRKGGGGGAGGGGGEFRRRAHRPGGHGGDKRVDENRTPRLGPRRHTDRA